MNNKILETYNQYANHLVARILRYGIILMALVGIASDIKIFVIDVHVMRAIVLTTCIIYLIPTLLFNVLKIYKLWAELLVLSLIVLMSGIMYVFLSYHVVITFIIPVCMACLYNGKRYPIFTTIITIPVMILAHLVAFKLKVVPDEPLVTLHGVIYYGIVPRMIQFVGCSLICIGVASRTRKLILNLLNLNEKQLTYEEVLHKVITESEGLISAIHYKEITLQAVNALKGVLEALLQTSLTNITFRSGYCIDPSRQLYYIYQNGPNGIETLNLTDTQLKAEQNGVFITPFINQPIYIDKTCLSMLFKYQNQTLGFIQLNLELRSSLELMDILKVMYNQIEKSMINIHLNSAMLDTQHQVIQSLAEICESKSKQTGQHIKRVSEYMYIMGEEMGLDPQQRDYLAMAAMLHDVGKLKIPDEILEKPGKLTDNEFDQIKQHVHIGKQLLENCKGEVMELGCVIAHQHHEKWDGTGYMGLKGNAINEYARIVAVIDVFDALVSKRSYKASWTPEAAYDEIVKHSGSHFAPDAVELFKRTYPKLVQVLALYPDESYHD